MPSHLKNYVVTMRMPRDLAEAVQRIAEREYEKESTILRRLVRRGLQIESSSDSPQPITSLKETA